MFLAVFFYNNPFFETYELFFSADLFMMTLLPKALSSLPKRCHLPLCQWITPGHA